MGGRAARAIKAAKGCRWPPMAAHGWTTPLAFCASSGPLLGHLWAPSEPPLGLLWTSPRPVGQPRQPASKPSRPVSQLQPGSEDASSHQPTSQPWATSQSLASHMPTIIRSNNKGIWGAELLGPSRLPMAGHVRPRPPTAAHGCPRPPTAVHGWATSPAFWASSGYLLRLF